MPDWKSVLFAMRRSSNWYPVWIHKYVQLIVNFSWFCLKLFSRIKKNWHPNGWHRQTNKQIHLFCHAYNKNYCAFHIQNIHIECWCVHSYTTPLIQYQTNYRSQWKIYVATKMVFKYRPGAKKSNNSNWTRSFATLCMHQRRHTHKRQW